MTKPGDIRETARLPSKAFAPLLHTFLTKKSHKSPKFDVVFPLDSVNMAPFDSIETLVKARPRLSATGALMLGAAFIAYQDYRSYVAMGPHGLPATFWGWYRQLQMTRRARKDTTVPAPYDFNSIAGAHDGTSFLPQTQSQALSWRPGNRDPEIPGFVAPQRQLTDQATETTKQTMYGYLDALVAANPDTLQTQTSTLEGPVPAVGMKGFAEMADGSKPEVLRCTRGELCHIHPPDGSTHVLVSLADQKRVIELGWGRRHRLSGGGMLPWNYTFIYAPRNTDEIEVWKRIVVAAAKFCCEGTTEIQAPS